MAYVKNSPKTPKSLPLNAERLTLFAKECEFAWKFKYSAYGSLFLCSSYFPEDPNSSFQWVLEFREFEEEATLLANKYYCFGANISLHLLKERKIKTPVLSEIYFYFSICGTIVKQNDILVSGEALSDPVQLVDKLKIKVSEGDSLEIYVKILTKFRPMSSPASPSCRQELEFNTKLFKYGMLSDLVIHAGRRRIPIKAHRSILSKFSIVFQAMFRKMSTLETAKIIIEDFEVSTIKTLLRFIYTHKIAFNEVKEAANLLRAADKYDLSDLSFYCANYLKRAVNEMNANSIISFEMNAISLLLFADKYGIAFLKERVLKYIVTNQEKFKEFRTFRSIREKNAKLLEEIISSAFSEPAISNSTGSKDSSQN